MTIFEIDREIAVLIENSIDPETGELLLDEEKLEALQMSREKKIENILMYYKDTLAYSKAIKEEIDSLSERKASLERKADRLKTLVETVLKGETFETPKVKVTYRESKSVELTDDFLPWAKANRDDLLRYKEPEVDKKAVREALTNGDKLTGASIAVKRNMQISGAKKRSEE